MEKPGLVPLIKEFVGKKMIQNHFKFFRYIYLDSFHEYVSRTVVTDCILGHYNEMD